MNDLSIVVPTMNSEAHIALIADYYDDLGVAPYFFVDMKSTDRTFDMLAARSRRVFPMHNEAPIIEAKIEEISRVVPSNWVLRIDDDELPSAGLLRFASNMVAADCYEAIGFLRHQCAVSRTGALLAHRGHDPGIHRQYRLYRRDKVRYRTNIHTPGFHFDDLRVKFAPTEYFLIHLDWAVRSHAERQNKITTYNSVADKAGDVWKSYYLPKHRPDDFKRLEACEFNKIALEIAHRFPENAI